MSESKIITFPVEIRFSDLDAMGHVNNAVYFTYFEEGRKNLFFKYVRTDPGHKFDFILAKATCDYKLPLLLEDRAVMEMWVGQVGRKSFTFRYRIRDEADPAKVYAEGETVMVSYDYETGKSVEISVATRAKLDSMLID